MQAGSARPGGRTARTRAAVLDAVRAVLGSADPLTVERVAQLSGVHPATIYRRWGTVDGLVVDLLTELTSAAIPVPDTGGLDGDLRALARDIAAFYADPRRRALIEAVVSAAARAPWAAQALHAFFASRLERTSLIVRRAVDRGELPAGTDAAEVIAAVGAPFYYRLFILREPVDAAVADRAAAAAAVAARAGTFRDGP